MAHSVEFLLDDDLDARVRSEWTALIRAGLPSQGSIDAPTNRPHVTALAATRIDPAADAALAGVAMRLPFPVTLGAPVIFGRGDRATVARLVIPSTDLLSAHAQAVRLVGDHAVDADGAARMFAHSRPGDWTPHVTLARRVPTDRLPDVLAVVLGADVGGADLSGRVVGIRRWDGDQRTEHVLAGRDC